MAIHITGVTLCLLTLMLVVIKYQVVLFTCYLFINVG